ncbi:MAG TPA: peptidase S24 [Candidatus Ignatzschineria merdigallinarum]|uniref:Peptidase S24 n=1 Tax=Candidatus Ignatzschineria merdigallinarum TaxID=2838621 RepID=A0A9D1Q5S4_9GAMM|nr:peptidase S24 [Candidatus Ignatzschineria merdigallinarum]
MKEATRIRAENLKAWIDKYYGGKQAAFIEKTGMNQGELSALINGRRVFGERKARSIEELADMPNMYLEQTEESELIEISADMKGMVPVISWVAAGNFSDAEVSTADELIKWVPCPAPHSKGTYALTVSGISMQNPNGNPSFEDGDIIFVDPAKLPENKSCVIVSLEGSNSATFKQLVIEPDGRKYIIPLNPNWGDKPIEIEGDASINGVVIGKWVNIF